MRSDCLVSDSSKGLVCAGHSDISGVVKEPWDLFVGCAPGLEALLAAEIEAALGGAPVAVVPGGVEVVGGLSTVATLNLRLGVATHVLVRLARFRAKHFSQLEKALGGIDWAPWLTPGAPYGVRVHAKRSKLYHTKAIEQRVRRVVQQSLRAESVPAVEEGAPTLLVRIVNDDCEVSIDSSGAPLHRRGYRLATAKAPLREDLARAVVRLSGWDPGTAFFDPFCGSGTLAIEAALLARDLAPGRNRSFAFEAWPVSEPSVVERARAQADARALERAPGPIWASDRDAGAVKATAENASRAGVQDDLRIAEAPMGRAPMLEAPPARGAWVSNPPHGRRVGEQAGLRKLHQSLGRRFASLGSGWGLTLLVRDRRLAYATGVTLESRLMTESGGSKVWILSREGRDRLA